MKISQHRIVRRAFSQYEVAEIFTGSWVDAMQRASELQAYSAHGGEYSVRRDGEPLRPAASASYQSGMDWL